MTTDQPIWCPRCGQPDARLTGDDGWTGQWSSRPAAWLMYTCDQCEAAFRVKTAAGRRAEIASDVRHLRYLESHGWRAEMTDADALAMGKRLRPLYLRLRFAIRIWWPLRAAGLSPAEAWEKLFSVGGRSVDPEPAISARRDQ